ncbi:BRcat domain-containing protein [Vibrio alginolyticus]|uniref:BRcat domain-containing protein n=1 Tax=Vibrio alginolyticus TaxID=663 RepID=UPI0018E3AC68|nr:hypothetical protein [Vibrio alginolyticus]
MVTPSLPNQIDNDPISVQERRIRQFDCPNPNCESSIDITNVNVGTKIQCTACQNVTWLPDYSKKWWQKPLSILSGLFLSFLIGIASSMTATWLSDTDAENTPPSGQGSSQSSGG